MVLNADVHFVFQKSSDDVPDLTILSLFFICKNQENKNTMPKDYCENEEMFVL